MSSQSMTALTLGTSLGAGLVTGVFFAFSTFVMGALARLPASQGVAAMQSINVVVIHPLFMSVLFGTALSCLGLSIASFWHLDQTAARLRIGGAMVYLCGSIAVTMAFNVPRNEALAALDPGSAQAILFWPRYLAEWTAFNHVRSAASFLAAALFALALLPWSKS